MDVAVEVTDEVAVTDTVVDAEDVAVVVTVVFRQLEYAPEACFATAAFKTVLISAHCSAPSTTNKRVNPWHVTLLL